MVAMARPPRRHPFRCEIKQISADTGGKQQMRHEQEKRHRADGMVCRETEGGDTDAHDGRIEADQETETGKADQAHGKAYGHAEADQREQDCEACKTY
jgi:hypothetical protein